MTASIISTLFSSRPCVAAPLVAAALMLSACDDSDRGDDPYTDDAEAVGKADGADDPASPEGEPVPDLAGPLAFQCWDHTFNYNVATVQETSDGIDVIVSGAGLDVVDIVNHSWNQEVVRMTFAPESCTVSDDGRLVTCQAVDLPVTLDAYSDFIDDEWVVVDAETREVGWVLVEMVQVSRLNAAGTVFEGFEFTLDTTNEDFDRSTTRYFFAGGEGLWGSCNNDPSTWTFHGQ